MAKDVSFDISAKVDIQELKNAVDQSQRELSNRYDFKGILCEIELKEKDKLIEVSSSNDNKVDALKDILISKMVKRGLDVKSIQEDKREAISGGNLKATYKIIDVIDKKEAKDIVAFIKSLKLKITVSIQGDSVRVSGKNKDDLQTIISKLKEKDWEAPLTFENYR